MAVAVPDDLDVALTPEWLTGALRPRFPGLEVRAVARGPVVERLSTNARFTIESVGAAGGSAWADCATASSGSDRFYRDCRVDRCRTAPADVDPQTRHGVAPRGAG